MEGDAWNKPKVAGDACKLCRYFQALQSGGKILSEGQSQALEQGNNWTITEI
jgi:hypothetical protein